MRKSLSPSRLYRRATAHTRRLPDYLVVGAQKAGTTSLWAYLIEHPQVEASSVKEVHYFDNNFHRGPGWYRSHFAVENHNRGRFITGDTSPYYMFHPLAPLRAGQTVPNAKIIFLLRNPVDRAFSHYHLSIRRRRETLTFDEALATEQERLAGESEAMVADPTYRSNTHSWHSYAARGRYFEQIERWLQYFAPEQMLFIESGELFRQPEQAYAKVLEFLGLPDHTPSAFGNHYPGKYKEQMARQTREQLTEYFRPYNQELYDHLGIDFGWEAQNKKKLAA